MKYGLSKRYRKISARISHLCKRFSSNARNIYKTGMAVKYRKVDSKAISSRRVRKMEPTRNNGVDQCLLPQPSTMGLNEEGDSKMIHQDNLITCFRGYALAKQVASLFWMYLTVTKAVRDTLI
jgi:hypothetical protein